MKLGNILFAKELQRRADREAEKTSNSSSNSTTISSNSSSSKSTSWLTAVSLEPGIVATDIWRHMAFGYDPRTLQERDVKVQQPENRSIMDRLTSPLYYSVMTPVERGANSQIWLAASASDKIRSIKGGQHYDEFRNPKSVPEFANSQESARRL